VVAGAALLFAIPTTGSGGSGDETGSQPLFAWLRSLCAFLWLRERLRAAELPGAVVAGEDRMEPGQRPRQPVN